MLPLVIAAQDWTPQVLLWLMRAPLHMLASTQSEENVYLPCPKPGHNKKQARTKIKTREEIQLDLES